jgi:predicted esterase
MRALVLLVAAVAFLAGPPAALAGKPKPVEIVEEAEGDLVHLFRKDDAAAQGWLHRPKGTETPDPAKPVDLIVVLHGAGGTPKTLFLPQVMEARRAWCLGVAGHSPIKHEKGDGFMWDGANVSYILDLTRYLLEKYPVRKDRVIVWGHSAGGSMTLATLAEAPTLFAGGLTTAAPQTPDTRHRDLRVAVLLGTDDPNWSGAAGVRSYLEGLEKKKAKGACAFFGVRTLGHDLPEPAYIALGFDWVLHGKARGGEASVPLQPVGASGPWRHVLARFKGAEGAGDDVKTSKKAAGDLLKKIKKELDAGRALFPFEAACHSDDAKTASCGGGIEEEPLRALVGTLPELEPGKVSEVLESPRGMHLLYRSPVSGE